MVILPSRLYLMETQLSGSQSKLLVAWIIVYRNEAAQSAMKTMGFCGPWLENEMELIIHLHLQKEVFMQYKLSD